MREVERSCEHSRSGVGPTCTPRFIVPLAAHLARRAIGTVQSRTVRRYNTSGSCVAACRSQAQRGFFLAPSAPGHTCVGTQPPRLRPTVSDLNQETGGRCGAVSSSTQWSCNGPAEQPKNPGGRNEAGTGAKSLVRFQKARRVQHSAAHFSVPPSSQHAACEEWLGPLMLGVDDNLLRPPFT